MFFSTDRRVVREELVDPPEHGARVRGTALVMVERRSAR